MVIRKFELKLILKNPFTIVNYDVGFYNIGCIKTYVAITGIIQ